MVSHPCTTGQMVRNQCVTHMKGQMLEIHSEYFGRVTGKLVIISKNYISVIFKKSYIKWAEQVKIIMLYQDPSVR